MRLFWKIRRKVLLEWRPSKCNMHNGIGHERKDCRNQLNKQVWKVKHKEEMQAKEEKGDKNKDIGSEHKNIKHAR